PNADTRFLMALPFYLRVNSGFNGLFPPGYPRKLCAPKPLWPQLDCRCVISLYADRRRRQVFLILMIKVLEMLNRDVAGAGLLIGIIITPPARGRWGFLPRRQNSISGRGRRPL